MLAKGVLPAPRPTGTGACVLRSCGQRQAGMFHQRSPAITTSTTVSQPRRALVVQAASAQPAPAGGVRARWCLDVRYGRKQEATVLLQEWVTTIGSEAGLNAGNTAISSGAIGVPESRLEMEVTLGSMAEWEAFLAAVPSQEHQAWSQRLQGMVVDASTRWEVYRVCAVTDRPSTVSSSSSSSRQGSSFSASTSNSAGSGTAASGGSSSKLVIADKVMPEDEALWQATQRSSSNGTSPVQQPPAESNAAEQGQALDWKGEPMQINPGDKLPFKFL